VKVLFLRQAQKVRMYPTYEAFVQAIGGRYEVVLFDPEKPAAEQFKDVRVVVDDGGSQHSRELIDLSIKSGVQLWHVTTNGLDHVNTSYFFERGMPFAHAAGPQSAVALAEHVLLIILYFAKNLHINRAHEWFERVCNEELEGRVLSIVGLGASGRELARRARPFGLRIMTVDIAPVPRATLDELRVEFFGDLSHLDEVAAAADYLSIHTPLTDSTRHLIDRRVLGMLRPSTVLINVARGEIVEEAALVEALQSKRIKGAGIDTYAKEPLPADHPFLSIPNVITTPHIAGVTDGTFRRRAEAAAENVHRIAQGLAPKDVVKRAI
jgi:phosphoglycerate dehydrogenase-like enzyme